MKMLKLMKEWTMAKGVLPGSAEELKEADRCGDDFYQAARELVVGGPKEIDLELARQILGEVSSVKEYLVVTPREAFALGAKSLGLTGIARLEQVAWYAAGYRLSQEPQEIPELVDHVVHISQVWDAIELEDKILLIPHPDFTKVDADDEFHCADGPALSWTGKDGIPGSGGTMFFHHGVFIPKWVSSPTQADLLKRVSAEERRAIQEWIGADRVIELLGLKPKDEAVLQGLSYTLFVGDGVAWLRMQSPLLKDGTQPYYTEPVHEDCKTCAEAKAWRATGDLGCSVSYGFES